MATTPVPGTIVRAGSQIGPGGDSGIPGVAGAAGPAGPQGVQGYEGSLVGTISAWPSAAAPPGWLLCDGSLQSRATYAQLFGVVGITYGSGDGSTTFALPDLRSRFVLGAGAGGGLTNRVLAAIGGEETHVLSVAELAPHGHSLTDNGHVHNMDHYHLVPTGQFSHGHGLSDAGHQHGIPAATANSPNSPANYTGLQYVSALATAVAGTGCGVQAAALPQGQTNYASQTSAGWVNTGNAGTGIGINNTGSGTGHNNIPPFIVLTYIIRASYQIPQTGPSVPLADTTQPGLLIKVSGLATDFIDGTNACHNFANAVRGVQGRTYNAIGNPNTEINQRRPGAGAVTIPASWSGSWVDRWYYYTPAGPASVSLQQNTSRIVLPGTNFLISNNTFMVTLVAQNATLAAGDYLFLYQSVEGPRLRELINDVHSVSLLVRSTVANLQFGLFLKDPTGTRTLTKLCTIPSANSPTLISLPNLPLFPSAGTFSLSPGNAGFLLGVVLACGSTNMSPANDAWQNGSFVGALGQSNFCAQAIGSTFELAFCQHEPGAVCNPFLDLPWEANHDSCLRYYAKSYDYAVPVGTNGADGYFSLICPGTAQYFLGYIPFPKRMAKVPTLTIYDYYGTANSITSLLGNVPTAIPAGTIGTAGFSQVNTTNAAAAFSYGQAQFAADTGW